MAHELTHVVQQKALRADLSESNGVTSDYDLENEAEAVANSHQNEHALVLHQTPTPSIQLQEEEGGAPPPSPAPAPCTPRPVATLNEFRNADGSNTSRENCCAVCPVPLGVGAGGQARHGMEMRIEITNPCPAAYEITRVREDWLWERVGGVWRELQHQGPGERDDHHDYDECHTLQRGRFLYVIDIPGFPVALPAPTAWRFRGMSGVVTDPAATEVVAQYNFAEWVMFRHRGHGIPWTVISSPRFFYWHDILWLEKGGGGWRLRAGSNRIARGLRRPVVSP